MEEDCWTCVGFLYPYNTLERLASAARRWPYVCFVYSGGDKVVADTLMSYVHLVFGLLVDGKRNPGVRNDAHQARGYPTVECRRALFPDDSSQQL